MIGDQPIAVDVTREKYCWKEELTLPDVINRVYPTLTAKESDPVQSQVYQAALKRQITVAGRVLAGAGTDKRVTLINCFVSPEIQDSLRTLEDMPGKGIMDACSVAAFTQQMGGGIGMDYSTIRPRGALVKRTQSVSSGVVPFMSTWDSMCQTIRSAGDRRGAMMATLAIWHPDIREFINSKRGEGALTNFNISVLVTEEFMTALDTDSHWDLVFPVPKADGQHIGAHIKVDADAKPGQIVYIGEASQLFVYERVRARELWDEIIGSTYVHAEPGIIFIDRVNELNNLQYCEHIHCTNPCGEQPLPPNGDCNLGHTNLAEMVTNPFTDDAEFDYKLLEANAKLMVRLLDNVIDITEFPVVAQLNEAQSKRRVGLGFMGLASALQQLGVTYGSTEAVNQAKFIAQLQAEAAYWSSVELARERGPFPLFDKDEFMKSRFVRKLPSDLQDAIAQYGVRNGVLLSIAPTGTTSIALGNVSGGIEPVFAHKYKRRVRGQDGEMNREYDVLDYGYRKYCAHVGEEVPLDDLPLHFVTAADLTVKQHLEVQASVQEWTDASISKTINCPESMTFEEFKSVYDQAYDLGLKSCTTYRPDPNSTRGYVLKPSESSSEPAPMHADKIDRPRVVEGRSYQLKWPNEDCAYYIQINDYIDDEGKRRPLEIFMSTKSARHDEWIKALSLMITAIFRRGGDPSFVIEELQQVYSARGGTWMGGRYVRSLVAAISEIIAEHFEWLGLYTREEQLTEGESVYDPRVTVNENPTLETCEKCGMKAVTRSEGCSTCHACGHSDCG